jgi:ParB-like chromosome segregation protein Spo0J
MGTTAVPPPMQIEPWPISRLVEYKRNPRKNDAAVDRMCDSIKEFGFKIPILARSPGEIVDGHLRFKAAKKLGMLEVPVILCDEWSEAQVRAFRLMVNRSVTWASWDEELLGAELRDIRELGFDLELTGFAVSEIDDQVRIGWLGPQTGCGIWRLQLTSHSRAFPTAGCRGRPALEPLAHFRPGHRC